MLIGCWIPFFMKYLLCLFIYCHLSQKQFIIFFTIICVDLDVHFLVLSGLSHEAAYSWGSLGLEGPRWPYSLVCQLVLAVARAPCFFFPYDFSYSSR